MEYNDFVDIQALSEDLMRTKDLHNLLLQRSRTDLDRTSDKNLLADGLVKPIRKFAKSVTKTNSKVQALKIYNKVINNPIYGNRW